MGTRDTKKWGADPVHLMLRPYQLKIHSDRENISGLIEHIIGNTSWLYSTKYIQCGFMSYNDMNDVCKKLKKFKWIIKLEVIDNPR